MAQRKVSAVRHLRSRRGRSFLRRFLAGARGRAETARTADIRPALPRLDISRAGHNLFNLSEVELQKRPH